MKTLTLAAIATLALAGSAQAQRFTNLTGGKLVELCSSRDRIQAESCTAYINGISDAVSFYQRLMPADGSKGSRLPDYVCVPGPTTGPQLRQAVVDWAKRHQESMNETAAQVTLRALNDSYLCPGEQRRNP